MSVSFTMRSNKPVRDQKEVWDCQRTQPDKILLYRYVVCRRFEGVPFKSPPPPPLARFQINEDPAFSYTIVDFAGSLSLRVQGTTPGKARICLYTCFVTRAIHLDAVPASSTQTFIRCIKRFVARRGLPCKAKTFKSAATYLKAILSDSSV